MNQRGVLTKPTNNPAQSMDGLISVTMQDPEAMIRRAVEEAVNKALHNAVQKELQQANLTRSLTIGEDWIHEGPDDPEGDAELLAEALVTMEKYKLTRVVGCHGKSFKPSLPARRQPVNYPLEISPKCSVKLKHFRIDDCGKSG